MLTLAGDGGDGRVADVSVTASTRRRRERRREQATIFKRSAGGNGGGGGWKSLFVCFLPYFYFSLACLQSRRKRAAAIKSTKAFTLTESKSTS